MKTIISNDEDTIVYQFTSGDKSIEFRYHKKGFVFFDGQEVDFDAIAENDLQNWIKTLQ
jgi:hypothetical protein